MELSPWEKEEEQRWGNPQQIICPMCKKKIDAGALKCPHCHESSPRGCLIVSSAMILLLLLIWFDPLSPLLKYYGLNKWVFFTYPVYFLASGLAGYILAGAVYRPGD